MVQEVKVTTGLPLLIIIMIIIIINQSQHQACKYFFSKGHLSDQVTTFCRTNQKSSGQYLQLVHVS